MWQIQVMMMVSVASSAVVSVGSADFLSSLERSPLCGTWHLHFSASPSFQWHKHSNTHILALPAVCRVAHSDICPPCSLPSTPQQMGLLTFPISTLATLGPHSQAVNLVRSALPPLLALRGAHTLTAFSLAGLSLSSHVDLSTTVNCLPAITLITMPALSLAFWLCSAAVSLLGLATDWQAVDLTTATKCDGSSGKTARWIRMKDHSTPQHPSHKRTLLMYKTTTKARTGMHKSPHRNCNPQKY